MKPSFVVTGGSEFIVMPISDNHQLLIMQRNTNGTFKQIRKPFSLDNFNDGYVDNRGRFRVWLPNHPRVYAEGYVLRAIVAYELYHNVTIPEGMDVHHKDHNKLNDSIENLVLFEHHQHSIMHNPIEEVIRTCVDCGKDFTIKKWRLKDPKRGKFCNQICYRSYRKQKKEGDNF